MSVSETVLRRRRRANDPSNASADALSQRRNGALEELQLRLGNARLGAISEGGAQDARELYLSQLLAVELASEHDMSPYLPWNSSLEWMRFVERWYRVLWAERELEVDQAPVIPERALDSEARPLGAALSADGLLGGPPQGWEAEAEEAQEAQDAEVDVARKARGETNFSDPSEVEAWVRRLRAQSGAGRDLDAAERGFLREVHGRELPRLTLHEDSAARAAAAEVNAVAFTIEDEIWLGAGVDPETAFGAEVLAHETTHVLQNAAGRGAGPTAVSRPGQPLEVEAEARGRQGRAIFEDQGGLDAWSLEAPELVDVRGRLLTEVIRAQLPEEATRAPEGLVDAGLKELLERQAWSRVDGLRATLEVSPELSEDRREALLAELDEVAAGMQRDLSLMARIVGAPGEHVVHDFARSFAPYPELGQQLSDALSGLSGPDPLALDMGPDAFDTGLLSHLVQQLSQALRLGPVTVRTDEAAANRARALGTRGVAEGGEVLLDPARFDPATPDGRGLVAHELTHVAQDGLSPAEHAQPGMLAEAEAHHAAERFARGGAMPDVQFGVPDGHVAAEGDLGGAELTALLAQYTATTQTAGSTITPANTAPANNATTNATEDHDSKVDQYEDGVDGIADQIGDLEAFDELCSAIDDGEDTTGPLGRIRASEPYQQLCRMWQGAKEGGVDSARMMAIFNNEFDGRGFWAETEQAFDLVEAAAKRDAKPEPESGAAHNDAAQADANAENAENAIEEGVEEGEEGVDPNAPPGGEGVSRDDPAIEAFMGASVEDEAPPVTAFDNMKAISDGQLDQILCAVHHQQNFAQNAPSIRSGRTSQITETLLENFGGSFVQGFIDQGIDALVWDNIGWGADQLLKLGSGGKLSNPMIGPLIGLIQNPPWTAAAWGGDSFTSMTENWGRMGDTWDALMNAEGLDAVGVFCALVADFFGGLRDLIAGLQAICGTLSALCYVVGGILIIVGLALVWLAGIGAPLITAGGWLCRAGQLLGRVNSILGLAVLALSGITTVFRTAAAFMVPADMYAQQLELVGADAGTFGEKAGAKVADTAAEGLNNKVRGPIEQRVNDRIASSPPSSGGEGAGESERIRDAQEQDAQRLQDEAEDASQRVRDEEERRRQEAEEEEGQRRNQGDDDPQRSRLRRFIDRVPILGRTLNDLGAVWTDFREICANPGRAGREALSPQVWQAVEGRTNEKLRDTQTRIQELNDTLTQLRDADGDALTRAQEMLAGLELSARQRQLEAIQRSMQEAEAGVRDAEAREALMRGEREAEDDPSQRQQELEAARQRVQDLETERARLQEELDTSRRQLQDAETREQETRARAEEAETALREHTESDAYKDRERQHLQDHADRQQQRLNDMDDLLTQARDLETQASNATQARQIRTRADQEQADADTARQQADATLAQLQGQAGTRVKLEAQGGTPGGLIHRQLISVGPDGVVVSNGRNATETLPLSAIRYPRALRDLAGQYEQQKSHADDLQTRADTSRTEANNLAPEGADPQALTEQAAAKRDQASQERANYDAETSPGRVQDATRDQLEGNRTSTATAAGTANTEAERLRGTIRTSEGELQTVDGDLRTAQRDLDEKEALDARMPGLQSYDEYMRGSSGNATGGVGSSYKDLAQSILNGSVLVQGCIDLLSDATRNSEYVRNRKPSDRSIGFTAEVALEDAFGIRREVGEELKAIGNAQAQREQQRSEAVQALVDCTPPISDMELMSQKKEAATAAYDRYKIAHARALRAYTAEQLVDGISKETKALGEQGQPLADASASMTAPLNQSVSDEASRNSTLTGGNTNIQQPESGVAGIVTQLIAKLAQHGDRLDDQPTPPDPEAGTAIQDGPEEAQNQSTQRSTESSAASDQQRQFLDQAIALRAAQQSDIEGNICSLETRYDQEQAILEEIKVQKAMALADREVAKGQVEENANGFVEQYNQMEAWRQTYLQRRSAVESLP